MNACRKKRISSHRARDANQAGGATTFDDELGLRPVDERTEAPGLGDLRLALSTVRRAGSGLPPISQTPPLGFRRQ